MATKSAESKVVRVKAENLAPTTPEELARLRALMDGPIDTSDSPERTERPRRLKRDASRALPQPLPELHKSPIRLAILAQLERLQMTRYQLWKAAQRISPQIPASAVYEYLRGQRAIGTPYVEALLSASSLGVVPMAVRSPKPERTSVTKVVRAAALELPHKNVAMTVKGAKLTTHTKGGKNPPKDRKG